MSVSSRFYPFANFNDFFGDFSRLSRATFASLWCVQLGRVILLYAPVFPLAYSIIDSSVSPSSQKVAQLACVHVSFFDEDGEGRAKLFSLLPSSSFLRPGCPVNTASRRDSRGKRVKREGRRRGSEWPKKWMERGELHKRRRDSFRRLPLSLPSLHSLSNPLSLFSSRPFPLLA